MYITSFSAGKYFVKNTNILVWPDSPDRRCISQRTSVFTAKFHARDINKEPKSSEETLDLKMKTNEKFGEFSTISRAILYPEEPGLSSVW